MADGRTVDGVPVTDVAVGAAHDDLHVVGMVLDVGEHRVGEDGGDAHVPDQVPDDARTVRAGRHGLFAAPVHVDRAHHAVVVLEHGHQRADAVHHAPHAQPAVAAAAQQPPAVRVGRDGRHAVAVTVLDGVQRPSRFGGERAHPAVAPRRDDLRAVVREHHAGARAVADGDAQQLLHGVHRPHAHVLPAGGGEHAAVVARERHVVHHERVAREHAHRAEVVIADGEQLAVRGAHQQQRVAHHLQAGDARPHGRRPHGHQQRTRGRGQPAGRVGRRWRCTAVLLVRLAGLRPLPGQLHQTGARAHHHRRAVSHQVQRRDALAVQHHRSTAATAALLAVGRRILAEAFGQRWRAHGRRRRRRRGRRRRGRKVQPDLEYVPGAGAAVHALVGRVDDRAQDHAPDLGQHRVRSVQAPVLPVHRPQPQYVLARHHEVLAVQVQRPQHRRAVHHRPHGRVDAQHVRLADVVHDHGPVVQAAQRHEVCLAARERDRLDAVHVRRVRRDHVARAEVPHVRQRQHVAGAHVLARLGHRHGRHDAVVSREEPLLLRGPVVRDHGVAERVHQVHAVRVHHHAVQRVPVETDQRQQFQIARGHCIAVARGAFHVRAPITNRSAEARGRRSSEI